MGGGERVKGVATYRCYAVYQRDPGRYTIQNRFPVSVEARDHERAEETDARLWKAAEQHLKDVIQGCHRKTLLNVQREGAAKTTSRATAAPSLLQKIWMALGDMVDVTKTAYASLPTIQKYYDR